MAVHCYIYFRYDNHTFDSHEFEFNTLKGNTTFILKEDNDRIQVYCTSEGLYRYFPNPGKFLQTYRFCTTLYTKSMCTPDHQTQFLSFPSHNYLHSFGKTFMGRLLFKNTCKYILYETEKQMQNYQTTWLVKHK